MTNELILVAKLIIRDMHFLQMVPQELKNEHDMAIFEGMGMALRHFYTAGTGTTFDPSRMTFRDLMKWVKEMPEPQLPKDIDRTITGKLT